ncbi:hypothetical protein HEQ72_04215 [Haematospirillum sp. 15-248]|nr:hypothetical protein [Haematospirillum sp. H4890]NKD74600.1 hypothetical protein [Haematospirillum sp. H4485]NKD87514.1 hypothetical protein [Haematospirillum sp. 15-248]
MAPLGCADGHIEYTRCFDVVISFGYRHILKKLVIESANTPIINLHTSYLPWNRGAPS